MSLYQHDIRSPSIDNVKILIYDPTSYLNVVPRDVLNYIVLPILTSGPIYTSEPLPAMKHMDSKNIAFLECIYRILGIRKNSNSSINYNYLLCRNFAEDFRTLSTFILNSIVPTTGMTLDEFMRVKDNSSYQSPQFEQAVIPFFAYIQHVCDSFRNRHLAVNELYVFYTKSVFHPKVSVIEYQKMYKNLFIPHPLFSICWNCDKSFSNVVNPTMSTPKLLERLRDTLAPEKIENIFKIMEERRSRCEDAAPRSVASASERDR